MDFYYAAERKETSGFSFEQPSAMDEFTTALLTRVLAARIIGHSPGTQAPTINDPDE